MSQAGAAPALLEDVACLSCGAPGGTPLIESAAQMALGSETYTFVRCQRCELVRLQPRVPASSIGRFYDGTYLPHRGASAWGRYAPLVERSQESLDRARVRRVLSEVRVTARSRVLDVGCGRPTFLGALRRRTGAHVVGLDFAADAWGSDPARWSGIELHRGTLESVRFSNDFDVLTLWHALEHEYDPLDALRRLRALARPGAALIVEVPNYDSLTRRLHGGNWAGFHTPRHTAAYTPASLAALLSRAGWRVERQLRHGTLDPYILWWLGRQERLGRSVRNDLSDRFPGFVLGRMVASPLIALQRWISLGVQTAVARA